MNGRCGVPILALAGAIVLGSCAGSSAEPPSRPDPSDQSSSGAPAANDLSADFAPDLEAPDGTPALLIDDVTGLPQFPTVVADRVRELADGDADLLGAADDIEALERVALDDVVAALVSGTAVEGIGPIDGTDASQEPSVDPGSASSGSDTSTTSGSEPQGFRAGRVMAPAQLSAGAAEAFSTLGLVTGYMTSLTAGDRPPVDVGGRSPNLALSDGVGAGMVMERKSDGRVTWGTDVSVNVDKPAAGGRGAVKGSAGVLFEVTADPCPAADGTVTLTFRARIGADIAAGSKGAIGSSEVSGTVVAQVDDTATISSFDLDARQQATGTNAAGVGTFVDTSVSYRFTLSGTEPSGAVLRPPSLNRESQGVDIDERSRLHEEGMNNAARFARGALQGLEVGWRDGKCVHVAATGGGKVSPGARTPIQVSVTHKRDGGALAVPVDATLSGPQSVDATRIDAAPGTVTHTASDASKSVATIEFVSTSRRGIGRATVTITAGSDSYVASGGTGVSFSGRLPISRLRSSCPAGARGSPSPCRSRRTTPDRDL